MIAGSLGEKGSYWLLTRRIPGLNNGRDRIMTHSLKNKRQ